MEAIFLILPPVTAQNLCKQAMERHLFQVFDSTIFENLNISKRSGIFCGDTNYIRTSINRPFIKFNKPIEKKWLSKGEIKFKIPGRRVLLFTCVNQYLD